MAKPLLNNITIVVNHLLSTELQNYLQGVPVKIKISTCTVPNSCLVPIAKINFLLYNLYDIFIECNRTKKLIWDTNFISSILSMIKIHKNVTLILINGIFNSEELNILRCLQRRFLKEEIGINPVHSTKQAVDLIATSIEFAISQEAKEIKEIATNHIGMLFKDDVKIDALRVLGLNTQESLILLDESGSIKNIATATVEDLKNCNVEQELSTHIYNIFNKCT